MRFAMKRKRYWIEGNKAGMPEIMDARYSVVITGYLNHSAELKSVSGLLASAASGIQYPASSIFEPLR